MIYWNFELKGVAPFYHKISGAFVNSRKRGISWKAYTLEVKTFKYKNI